MRFIILFFILATMAIAQDEPGKLVAPTNAVSDSVQFVDFIRIGNYAIKADSLANMNKQQLKDFNELVMLLKFIYPLRPAVVDHMVRQYIDRRFLQKVIIEPQAVQNDN